VEVETSSFAFGYIIFIIFIIHNKNKMVSILLHEVPTLPTGLVSVDFGSTKSPTLPTGLVFGSATPVPLDLFKGGKGRFWLRNASPFGPFLKIDFGSTFPKGGLPQNIPTQVIG
jgi:hypothetical protein